MTSQELQERINSEPRPILIHVLPPEVFSASRIPGSGNACIYETVFLEKAAKLIPEPQAAVIVYGAGGGGQEATVAAGRLREAGYPNVEVYEEGLDGWRQTGFPVEGTGEFPAPPPLDGEFLVDRDQSVIRWTGRNLFNHHSGTVKLGSGRLVLHDGRLIEAAFEVDLESIVCEDLSDPDLHAALIGHLRTGDFFLIDEYPTARFVTGKVEPIAEATPGEPNYQVHGEFTLRGVTRPLQFEAVIEPAPDGKRITGQAQFELDRTEFGSIYGSGRFFRFLGQHVVNDRVHLHLKIHADLAGAGAT